MITVIAQSARIARTISYALGADFEYNGYYANEILHHMDLWSHGGTFSTRHRTRLLALEPVVPNPPGELPSHSCTFPARIGPLYA